MIFGLIRYNSGPCFHRVHMPLLLMDGVDAFITNAVEEKHFDEKRPDWIYYNRLISDNVVNLKEKYGFKIAVDVDDYWHLDPHHIAFRQSRKEGLAAQQEKNLRAADVVTCTHARLGDMIYPFNRNVTVVPNAIPEHEYFPVERTHGERHRIFWQGSITHEADLKLLAGTMKKLDPGKFMSVMCGVTEHPAWVRMVHSFSNNLKLPGVALAGADPHEYYQNYQYADVCVVPLLSTKFNVYKSNLKVLEAAHSGLPVIASNVHPYKDMPLLYVNRESDWYDWLNDFEAQEEIAINLQAYCKKHFDYTTINQRRKDIFL